MSHLSATQWVDSLIGSSACSIRYLSIALWARARGLSPSSTNTLMALVVVGAEAAKAAALEEDLYWKAFSVLYQQLSVGYMMVQLLRKVACFYL